MAQIKYQIFVSATYEDLKPEREQVIKAILEMGHVPVGMEMFSAADQTQWKIISRTIDECDYYVVIAAHRYGSTEPTTGCSYTEKEYDYAIKKKVPTLGFVIDSSCTWSPNLMEKDGVKRTALEKLKEKIKKKYISYWKSTDDLHAKVTVALIKEINTNPRVGWIRADQAATAETTLELSRLSKENAALRKRIAERETEQAAREEKEKENVLRILKANKDHIEFWYDEDEGWKDRMDVSLERIFNILAPQLLIEKSVEDTARYLGMMLNWEKKEKLRTPWAIPSNTTKRLFSDFAALGLVEPSTKRHLTGDTDEYWSLTPKGREILADVRRKRLEAGLSATEPLPPGPNSARLAAPETNTN